MTKLHEIYKCELCGNMVEMVHAGAGELVCCGQKMTLMTENTSDGAAEKHVPFVQEQDVQIGEVLHPMTEEHHIEWIEVISDNGEVERKYLQVGEKPAWTFCPDIKIARAYCNLHGLWGEKIS